MTNKKGFLQNSAWGLASNILQNLFLSVFFVIIVNKLPLQDYSNYLIANSLYQAVASFSALGLGQWFIRQLNEETDFGFFLNKFLKIQILAGLFFYAFYLGFIYLLYDDNTVRILGILIGFGIATAIGFSFTIPWMAIIAAFITTFIVTIVSGLYPAIKASKLDPVEALRYE